MYEYFPVFSIYYTFCDHHSMRLHCKARPSTYSLSLLRPFSSRWVGFGLPALDKCTGVWRITWQNSEDCPSVLWGPQDIKFYIAPKVTSRPSLSSFTRSPLLFFFYQGPNHLSFSFLIAVIQSPNALPLTSSLLHDLSPTHLLPTSTFSSFFSTSGFSSAHVSAPQINTGLAIALH